MISKNMKLEGGCCAKFAGSFGYSSVSFILLGAITIFKIQKDDFCWGDGLCVAPFWTFCLTCARWHASCLACRHLFVWVDYMLTFVSTYFAPLGAPPHLQLQCTAAVGYPVSCSGSGNQLCVKRLVACKSNPKSGFVSGTESWSRKSACWEAVVQLQTKMLLLSRLLLILLVPLLFFQRC